MKKLTALLLALIMVVCCASCGGKKDNASSNKTSSVTSVSSDVQSVDETSSLTSDVSSGTVSSNPVPTTNDYKSHTYKLSEITDYYKVDGRSQLTTLTDAVTQAVRLENGADCITFKVNCEGDVTINVEYTAYKTADVRGFIRPYVDGEDKGRIEIAGVANAPVRKVLTVATGLKKGEHTIKIYRAIENMIGAMSVIDVTMNGVPLKKVENSKLYIEFFGDSITAGYGDLITKDQSVEGGNGGSLASDSTTTYAFKAAQTLGADISAVAASGASYVKGLGDYSVETLYNQLSFKNAKQYDFSRTADIVIISLGTNDDNMYKNGKINKEDLTPAAVSLMQLVKSKNPNAKVVWAYGMMGAGLASYIKAAVTQMGSGYYYFQSSYANYDGGGYHPNAKAHEAFAKELVTFLNKNVINK